jgi:hypothetical protein
MYGVGGTGVRFVLSNSADPERIDDAGAWYDEYARAIELPGLLIDTYRFENRSAAGTAEDPLFAAVYDIVAPDPADAWLETEKSPDYPTSLFDDPRSKLIVPVLRGSYALVGSRTTSREKRRPSGIYVVLSEDSDDTSRAQWAASVLADGEYYAASRYRLIEGFPHPPQWLEILETDVPDPEPPRAPSPATQRFAGLFRTPR